MRAILGVLLCFLFLQSQVIAARGGPDYGRLNDSTYVRGSYSGVLRASRVFPADATSNPNYIRAIGVFAATFADELSGTGSVVIFNQGTVSRATLDLVADANNKEVTGIIDGFNGTTTGFMELKLTKPSRTVYARYEGFKGTATVTSTSPITETIFFNITGYHAHNTRTATAVTPTPTPTP